MADTDQVELTDEERAVAHELNLGPDDLLKLPDYVKLAKELGIDLKDLLVNKNTSAVTVVNRTQHTLHFMTETRERDGHTGAGALKILPPNQIAPGETGTFLSGESPSSFLGLGGDEGWVTYAVGAPEHSQWTIHWNNPEKFDDNHADAEITFPSGQLEPDGTVIDYKFTVAFAQSGSTLVPFEFVLLEEGFGGGPDGVVDKNSCVITIMNETSQTLFLNETHFNDGDLVSFPDDEIPPDGHTTFTVSEKLRPDHRREGVSGFARYSVTQDPAHALWTVQWINPEQGPNVANDRIDGTSANLYQPGPPLMPSDQKENTPVRFVLRDHGGGTGPTPVPPKPEKETPPPETDEPTLRVGDHSVDGWVEYLQEMLTNAGYPVKIDGDFGQGTLTAVLRLQHDRNLQGDGIVGNQTWASLRGEDARPPSTDGRTPHTYVEQGPEARWYQEDNWVFYDATADSLMIIAYNVGNVEIGANQFTATADLTRQSDGASVQVHLTGAAGAPAPVGELFLFELADASHRVGPGTWTVHAWLPAELGGDDHNGTVTIG